MPAVPAVESFRREKQVEKWVLDGMDSRKIFQNIQKAYGVKADMARIYVDRAVRRIQQSANVDRQLEIARANERFHTVYREAMRSRKYQAPIKVRKNNADGKPAGEEIVYVSKEDPPNLFAAITAERARAELLGLNAPKKLEATVTHSFVGKRMEDLSEQELTVIIANPDQFKELPDGRIVDAEFTDVESEGSTA